MSVISETGIIHDLFYHEVEGDVILFAMGCCCIISIKHFLVNQFTWGEVLKWHMGVIKLCRGGKIVAGKSFFPPQTFLLSSPT